MELGTSIYIYRAPIHLIEYSKRRSAKRRREFDNLILSRYLFVIRNVLSVKTLIDFEYEIFVLSELRATNPKGEQGCGIWIVTLNLEFRKMYW